MNSRQRRQSLRASYLAWTRTRLAGENPGRLALIRGRCATLRKRLGLWFITPAQVE